VSSASDPPLTAAGCDTAIEALVRRDRRIALAGLVLVAALAWGQTFSGAGIADTDMAGDPPWSLGYAAMIVVMWWVMMVAMMVAGAAPLILLIAAVQRRRQPTARPYPTALLATAGYLAVWGAFSLAATLAQWSLATAGLLLPGMMLAGAVSAGVVLIAAGLYQLSPLKEACLRHCRTPLAFVTGHWRPGPGGAFRMGLVHGAYCLGCCWFLMGLLFVGGIMSPVWIGAIAAYVLVEKLAPAGQLLRRAAGVLLIAGGAWLVIGAN
jgi:predicted metal-binding membrane protein